MVKNRTPVASTQAKYTQHWLIYTRLYPHSLWLMQSNTRVTKRLIRLADESFILVNESLILADESFILADESLILADESFILVNESFILVNESLILADESLILADESLILADESLILADESLILINKAFVGNTGNFNLIRAYARVMKERSTETQRSQCALAVKRLVRS